jgi:putative ABC transport system permease protein
MYKSDQRTGTLFNLFAGIAIFISCLGLFGLTTYTAQVKTREIGIRKVLGATATGITGLLAKEFISLVIIAIAIASPLAWYGMNKWLQDYAYQTSLNIWIFIGAGFIAVLIALITVSFQSIRAALANPIHSLRNE